MTPLINESDSPLKLAGTLVVVYLATLGVKTLPLLLCACFPRRGRRLRGLAFCLFAASLFGLLGLAGRLAIADTVLIAAGLAYFLAVSALVFALSVAPRRASLGKDALFVGLGALGVFVPALFVRHTGGLALLVMGWDMTLAAYSYCVEAPRFRARPTFASFLFFVWVDPTLSYPERSRPARVPTREMLGCLARGTVVMLVGQGLVQEWPAAAPVALRWLGVDGASVTAMLLSSATAFFPVYWLRSGLAQVRIGLMAAIGFATPACFDRPYLANSPADFWRRWNCWVGAWLRRYVFNPLALWLTRRARRLSLAPPSAVPRSLALILSFLVMGVLHDWLTWAAHGEVMVAYVRVFAAGALGFLLWEALSASRQASQVRDSLLARGAARVFAASYVCLVVFLALPRMPIR